LVGNQKLGRVKTYDQLRDIKGYKLMTGISNSGKLQIELVINVPSELKTFMVKPDQQLLMLTNNLDYSTVTSIDITNRIKDSIKKPLTINQLLY
jgi:hypothetical protein